MRPAAALRVGYLDDRTAGFFGDTERPLVIRPEWVGELASAVGWLDVLVVDADLGVDSAVVGEAVAEARAIGAKVLGLGAQSASARWSGMVDAVAPIDSADPAVAVRQAVDPRRTNPHGYAQLDAGTMAVVGSSNEHPGAARLDPRADVADAVPGLRNRLGVVVPQTGLDAATSVRWIVGLAAAGVPVVVSPAAEVARRLHPDLMEAVRAADPAGLTDPLARDAISVRQRRAALRFHSVAHQWARIGELLGMMMMPPPAITVVLATNRPQNLDHALSQIARQTYEPRELVAILHGAGFSADAETKIRQACPGPVTVLRVSDTVSLGGALNRGVGAARGSILAKMDDDDWYGPEHLWDLMLALDYSGATIVGKAPEWVYLADDDITVQRDTARAEQVSTSIAGSTLMLRKADFDAIGGFRDAPRAIDRGLIRDVIAAGGTAYRTHGYGHVVNRHGDDHIWELASDADYFLPAADATWPGRQLERAHA